LQGIIEVVTYGYFFEATLSAKGGSYAQFAALIEKALLMIKRRLFLLNNNGTSTSFLDVALPRPRCRPFE
jgi:hypothetical protein